MDAAARGGANPGQPRKGAFDRRSRRWAAALRRLLRHGLAYTPRVARPMRAAPEPGTGSRTDRERDPPATGQATGEAGLPLLLRLLPRLRVVQRVSFALLLLGWLGWWAGQPGVLASLTGGWLAGTDTSGLGAWPLAGSGGVAGSMAEPVPDRRAAAPDFTLALFDGGTLRLAELRGQAVVVVNFWASWCPPCRAEAPTLAKVSRAVRDRGVVFVGVDIQDTDEGARAFLAEFGIDYPNGPDPAGQITTAYGVAGIPTTVFVDREGRIARRWLGGLTEQQLLGFVEEIAG